MTRIPLTLRKSDAFDDWYLIERRDHDGRRWEEPTPWGVALRKSARISDACVEGSAAEMLAIAAAIETRGRYFADRCAVWFDDDRAFFESPRNSQEPGVATLADADDLAREIRAALATETTAR